MLDSLEELRGEDVIWIQIIFKNPKSWNIELYLLGECGMIFVTWTNTSKMYSFEIL